MWLCFYFRTSVSKMAAVSFIFETSLVRRRLAVGSCVRPAPGVLVDMPSACMLAYEGMLASGLMHAAEVASKAEEVVKELEKSKHAERQVPRHHMSQWPSERHVSGYGNRGESESDTEPRRRGGCP